MLTRHLSRLSWIAKSNRPITSFSKTRLEAFPAQAQFRLLTHSYHASAKPKSPTTSPEKEKLAKMTKLEAENVIIEEDIAMKRQEEEAQELELESLRREIAELRQATEKLRRANEELMQEQEQMSQLKKELRYMETCMSHMEEDLRYKEEQDDMLLKALGPLFKGGKKGRRGII